MLSITTLVVILSPVVTLRVLAIYYEYQTAKYLLENLYLFGICYQVRRDGGYIVLCVCLCIGLYD